MGQLEVIASGRELPHTGGRLEWAGHRGFLGSVLLNQGKEPAITHQEDCPVLDHVMTLLIEHGPEAMASAFATLMNVAMEAARAQWLEAESHQRTTRRQGSPTDSRRGSYEPALGKSH
jgi:hypothetical protein